jgi:hypothetical protein
LILSVILVVILMDALLETPKKCPEGEEAEAEVEVE